MTRTSVSTPSEPKSFARQAEINSLDDALASRPHLTREQQALVRAWGPSIPAARTYAEAGTQTRAESELLVYQRTTTAAGGKFAPTAS
mgnify:CR=1 FL=1